MPRSMLAVLVATTLSAAGCSSGSETVAGPTTRLTLLPQTTTTNPLESTTTIVVEAPTTPEPATSVAATNASSPTAAPAPTTTTTPVDPVVEALQLSEEGIGAAVFSGDPDGVIAYLSSFIGLPTTDTGWVDPFDISACAGAELRVVSWGGLRLTFGDVSPVLEGRRHFFAYSYGTFVWDGSSVTVGDQTPPGLRTDTGVGLGSNLLALEAAYPGLELNPSDDFFPETYFVNDNMRGALSGLADDSTVVGIVGGSDCADPT